MKHTFKITLLLIFIFFAAQVIGLAITSKYIHVEEHIDPETNVAVKEIVPEDLPYSLERPQMEQSYAYIWILLSVLVGTAFLLILIKFKRIGLWKLWFFLAVFFTMAIAFSAFLPQYISAILALILAVIKIYKPMPLIHNITEVFIYGGIAAVFVPVINIFAAFMLLILISIYDIIAVRQTKHMVTLAKFQAETNVFAGLFLPYDGKGKYQIKNQAQTKEQGILKGKDDGRVAVLGGGDIGFPLLFAGVAMKSIFLYNSLAIGFLKSLIIPFFATIALSYLLINGKKDKFYPAMPYLSFGCFAGYAVVLLLF